MWSWDLNGSRLLGDVNLVHRLGDRLPAEAYRSHGLLMERCTRGTRSNSPPRIEKQLLTTRMVNEGDRMKTDEPSIDVLHISEAYGGGVQSAINSYIENAPGLRHRVFVRTRDEHDSNDDDAAEVIRISGSQIKFVREALKQIRAARPSVIHLHSSYAGLLRVFPMNGGRVIYSPHCYAFFRKDVAIFAQMAFLFIETLLLMRKQTIAAVSPFEVSVATRLNRLFKRSSVKYLPNIASPHNVTSGSPNQGHERPLIVCVGRLARQKSPDFLAEALDHVTTPIRCIWVGDGENRYKEQLLRRGVTVTGWVSGESARTTIAAADLFVHTAEWEGAPITLVDAAHAGIPILVRGIPHLDGLGFPTGGSTPAQLGTSIEKFFTEKKFRQEVADQSEESNIVHSCLAQQRALHELYADGYKAIN